MGVGADNHERRARKQTGWKAHIESKTQGADLPSSWRSTSTKTHSLPRTLVFRGFTSVGRGDWSEFEFELLYLRIPQQGRTLIEGVSARGCKKIVA